MAKRRPFLDLFLPPRCPYCGKVLPYGQTDCPDCTPVKPDTFWGAIPQPDGEVLPCAAPFRYQGAIRQALLRFKFRGEVELADFFAGYIAQIAEEQELPFTVLTNVPISPWRRLRRGYDQGALLARAAATCIRAPYRPLLRRCRRIRQQHFLLSTRARWDTVRNAFAVRPRAKVRGEYVLLIDDIATTGATLSACAQALRQAGAKGVVCLTAALAGRRIQP